MAVAVAATPIVRDGIRPLWREGARTIAKIVAGLPDDPGLCGERLGAGTGRRNPRGAPRGSGLRPGLPDARRRHGYTVRFIGQHDTAHATPGACPVLLWFEHTPNEAEDDLPAAVEAAGLTGLQDARLSVTRSPTGFVVRADR